MKTKLFSIIAVLFLAACSSGGGGGGSNPPVNVSLDGIYRGSPVVVSADNLTFDFDDPAPGGWQNNGQSGRVYETTVTGETIDGVATIYRNNDVRTQSLTGSVDAATGDMTLNFVDGPQRVELALARLAEPFIDPRGKAWCMYEFDNVTVFDCGEYDVLSILRFKTATHGTQNDITVTLGEQVDANVYRAQVDWQICSGDGVVGFAVSEDGTMYEMALQYVGPCGFTWFMLTSVR